ncbi:MAG TPA: SdiA-regulated domain-containing protein [Bacteroidia bacterium]|jgi:uncharacterized protein YjiK
MLKKIKYIFITATLATLAFVCSSCLSPYEEYNLANPEKSYTLPAALNEISGITILNENEIACVQDELGAVYVYDLRTASITKEYKTAITGDFEGITLVGNSLFLLRSDGVLVEYPDFRSPNMKIKEYFLNLPSENNEGLCYDMKNYRLLIAAKIKPGKEKENKGIRHIYSFDLKTKVPNNVPIFKLNVEDIEATARKLNIAIPYKTNKKTGNRSDEFNFRPSEIAVHPVNRNIYILSANDKLLLILDNKGAIKNLITLDPALFNKAEGLAFFPDGTMLISNEAQKGKPTLLTFSYRP